MIVGIITLPFGANYGWALQRWALYHVIESLGHTPIIINRKWTRDNNSLWTKTQRFVYYNCLCPNFKTFVEKECPIITSPARTSEKTTALTSSFDAIIVGSDQVWRIENTRRAGFDFFLDFVKKDSVLKLSYSASFGKDIWQGTKEETNMVKSLLQKFDAVSVREDSGVLLCRDVFGITAIQTLDPTLLLTQEDYNQLLSLSQNKKVIVSYFLDSSEDKKSLMKGLAISFGLRHVRLYPTGPVPVYKSVYEWLEWIRDAAYVVVDSFHGMVMSVVFHKKFVVIANEKRGLTRFTSLLKKIGLESRMTSSISVDKVSSILKEPIDYNVVDECLRKERNNSMSFLVENLTNSK